MLCYLVPPLVLSSPYLLLFSFPIVFFPSPLAVFRSRGPSGCECVNNFPFSFCSVPDTRYNRTSYVFFFPMHTFPQSLFLASTLFFFSFKHAPLMRKGGVSRDSLQLLETLFEKNPRSQMSSMKPETSSWSPPSFDRNWSLVSTELLTLFEDFLTIMGGMEGC